VSDFLVLDLSSAPSSVARNEAHERADSAWFEFIAAIINLTEHDRRAAAELQARALEMLLPGLRRGSVFRGPFS